MVNSKDLSTICVHSGELDDAHGSPHTPLYNTTTFSFKTTADILDVVEGRKAGSLYTRYGLNPTILSLEAKLAALEGAEAAWAFCSGMAAESALFMTHGRKGVVCIGEAYGGTMELISSQLPQLGIPGYMLLGKDLSRLPDIMKEGPGLVFMETPSNPTLEVFDIRAIAKTVHQHGAFLAVDNTFASPINQQPLSLGADFVIHSATKYLGGHSDITAGALMGSKDLLGPVWNWRKNLGQMPSPETASLLSRSLRTLPIRVQRQNETGMAVAKAMREHPKVSRVYYPGLSDFAFHHVAKNQMSGFGGMLSIEVKGTFKDACRVSDAFKIFKIAPSLGGAESLTTMPVTTTHHGLTPEDRAQRGVTDTMIRLSVGLENPQDLIDDLMQALNR